MKYIEGTAKQIAQTLGVTPVEATGLIAICNGLGLAEKLGTEQLDIKKKGKRAYVWKIPLEIKTLVIL
jgi:hypothetical protein